MLFIYCIFKLSTFQLSLLETLSLALWLTGILHPHLRGEGGQRREGPAGQNNAANTLIHQILHAEAGREAPVTQDVAYNTYSHRSQISYDS